ncbi:hypothetical protein HDU81_007464 [Chytriomyces hyalinus]|nr:hypothetical protein HDU81_007464 [Chytriomyces hyalinus]
MPRLASFANSGSSNITSLNISSTTPLEPDANNDGGGSGLSTPQFALVSIFIGLVIEVCFTGILAIILRVLRKESKNFWKIAILMLFFNVWCIAYTQLLCGERKLCRDQLVVECFWPFVLHVFMLYKTYAVSKRNKVVPALIILLLAHRAVWTVWDMAKSGGVYDSTTGVCTYYQYPLVGLGYNIADLIIDVFCAIVSIMANFGQLAEVIAMENSKPSFCLSME